MMVLGNIHQLKYTELFKKKGVIFYPSQEDENILEYSNTEEKLVWHIIIYSIPLWIDNLNEF